jgi:hypothetical protein
MVKILQLIITKHTAQNSELYPRVKNLSKLNDVGTVASISDEELRVLILDFCDHWYTHTSSARNVQNLPFLQNGHSRLSDEIRPSYVVPKEAGSGLVAQVTPNQALQLVPASAKLTQEVQALTAKLDELKKAVTACNSSVDVGEYGTCVTTATAAANT